MLIDQVVISNPGALPIWGAGLFLVLFSAREAELRPIGWVYVSLLVLALAAGKSRPDRIAGVYPVLFAAGAVQLEAARHIAAVRWTTWVSLGLAGALAVVVVLGGLPVLPPEQVARAMEGQDTDIQEEVGRSRLPVTLAHKTGWPEFIVEVERVLDPLSAEERARSVFLVDDYGHAGALELFGRGRDYPAVYSPHNNYYLWGPGPNVRPERVIAIGIDEGFLRAHFADVRQAGLVRCAYCNLWLDELPIRIATGPQRSLAELWPQLKQFGAAGRKLRMLRAQAGRAPG